MYKNIIKDIASTVEATTTSRIATSNNEDISTTIDLSTSDVDETGMGATTSITTLEAGN